MRVLTRLQSIRRKKDGTVQWRIQHRTVRKFHRLEKPKFQNKSRELQRVDVLKREQRTPPPLLPLLARGPDGEKALHSCLYFYRLSYNMNVAYGVLIRCMH